MGYTLSFVQKPKYIHFIITGENSPETVASYLAEIRRESERLGCYRILIEERLEGPRLGTVDIFRIVSKESGNASGAYRAVAYVDVNMEGGMMHFAETVAVNRAVPVRVFSTVSEAEKWLEQQE